MKTIKRPHNATLWFGILAGLYLVLNLVLSPSHVTKAQYHLSNSQYHALIFFILLPLMVIWFVAFYGYAKMKEYSQVIAGASEGEAFRYIANGMMFLAWGLPIPALIGTVTAAIANTHPGFDAANIIISNYANLIVPLVALHVLSSGSRLLLERAKLRISIRDTKLLVLAFVALGAVYCFYVFRNTGLRAGSDNPYFLPSWLLIITLVIPYMYAWFVGLLAAYEIRLVSLRSQGILYRRGLQLMSVGLAVTVASSIALQYLRTVFPRNGHISLGNLLLLIYAILVIIAVGYALLAAGANRLKKIEQV